MTGKMKSTDSDIRGSLPALQRAARSARRRARDTHTPFYVIRRGRVVNLNPVRRRLSTRSKRTA